jgi:hypothetical protein
MATPEGKKGRKVRVKKTKATKMGPKDAPRKRKQIRKGH